MIYVRLRKNGLVTCLPDDDSVGYMSNVWLVPKSARTPSTDHPHESHARNSRERPATKFMRPRNVALDTMNTVQIDMVGWQEFTFEVSLQLGLLGKRERHAAGCTSSCDEPLKSWELKLS